MLPAVRFPGRPQVAGAEAQPVTVQKGRKGLCGHPHPEVLIVLTRKCSWKPLAKYNVEINRRWRISVKHLPLPLVLVGYTKEKLAQIFISPEKKDRGSNGWILASRLFL